jgi:hypothetical protein
MAVKNFLAQHRNLRILGTKIYGGENFFSVLAKIAAMAVINFLAQHHNLRILGTKIYGRGNFLC